MKFITFDCDTQKGLCNDAPIDVKKNINLILRHTIKSDNIIIGSLNANEDIDPLSINYEKISETRVVDEEFLYTIANIRHGFSTEIFDDCYQIYFEKQGYDIWDYDLGQPDNVSTALRHYDTNVVVVVGNNNDDRIVKLVSGLDKRLFNVILISDAIINFNESKVKESVSVMTTENFIIDYGVIEEIQQESERA